MYTCGMHLARNKIASTLFKFRDSRVTSSMSFQENVAEGALKYPSLNAKILLSETSMCIPGVVSQTL
jgi:hypothetical protein